MNGSSTALRNKYARMSRLALIAGVIGVIGLVAGAFLDEENFFRSYIFGYTYWITITLGMLGWMLLHNMTAGKWGFTIRRFLQAGTYNGTWRSPLLLMLIAIIPIAFAGHHLYEWMAPRDADHVDHVLDYKAFYLNETFWYVRLVFYFLFWIFIAWRLKKLLYREERTFDERQSKLRTIQRLSGGGLVLFLLTVNFAMTDWNMSLEPHWFSTIYGVILLVGGAISAIALCNGMVVTSSENAPFNRYLDIKTYHDLGNLMFALTVFWAYVSFSQYIIIWSANLAEETSWYLRRTYGINEVIGYFLLVFHFIFPFLVLINRTVKRNPVRLRTMAIYILTVHFVDIFWQIKPAFQEARATGLNFHILDIAAVLGIGGFWLYVFLSSLATTEDTLLPAHDPRMRGGKPVLDEAAHPVNA